MITLPISLALVILLLANGAFVFRFLCSFSHIFAGGYAAGYYSYKWAETLSADAFAAFEEAGLNDQKAKASMGRRFRDTVLALGGGRAPELVFRVRMHCDCVYVCKYWRARVRVDWHTVCLGV